MVSSWGRKAQRFSALDPDARRLVLSSALLLPLFWLRLKLLGRWQPGCCDAAASDVPAAHQPASLDVLRHMGKLVNAAAQSVLPPDNCLTRSLVLQWLLRRRGVPTDLRLGVQLTNGQLRAHAWIEFDGHPLNDAPDVAERFLPLERAVATRSVAPA